MIYAGVDLGGINIKAGLINEDLSLICKASAPTDAARGAEAVIKDMAKLIVRLAEENGISQNEIAGVGIGIPGVAKNGTVIELVNLYWRNVPLEKIFRQHLDVPIAINNDATVAGIYEYHLGVLAGTDVGVFLTLGTGIGGGIVIGGKPFSGAHGLGSELGHIPIVPNGLSCTCGGYGCLENYASATALIGMGRKCVLERPKSMLYHVTGGDHSLVTAKLVFDCAKDGDNIAIALIDEYIYYLSMGIIGIMNSLDPDVIALGGGISAAGDYLLSKVTAACEGKCVFGGQKYADIKIAKSGNDAGLVGAAMLIK